MTALPLLMFPSEHLFVSCWNPSFFVNPPLLDFRLLCKRSRSHHRLACVFSLHIVFRLPFCLWLWFFPFSDSAVCFSSAAQEGWQLSLFMFSSGCLFTFGWNFPLLVSLPLFISLICCAENVWQRSLVSGVNLPPQGDNEQWLSPRFNSEDLLLVLLECSIF